MNATRTSPGPVAGRVLRGIDRVCDVLALSALASMVVVISWQVFGRYVLNSSPRWSSEVALILLVWLGFLGIAIGARERTHIAVEFLVERFSPRWNRLACLLAPALLLLFGIYLVVQGWSFTRLAMNSTLPSTGLPTAVQYAAMPATGLLLTVYGFLQLLGIDTRTAEYDDPAEATQPTVEGEAGR